MVVAENHITLRGFRKIALFIFGRSLALTSPVVVNGSNPEVTLVLKCFEGGQARTDLIWKPRTVMLPGLP